MGILAPLVPKESSLEAARLHLTTGAGSLMPGMLFLFFALAVGGMSLASAPLLERLTATDPALTTFVPAFLKLAGALSLAIGLGLLGYRQFITCEGKARKIVAGRTLWGIPLQRIELPYAEIAGWNVHNQLPKRYRPELNTGNKPAGHWRLELRSRGGRQFILDRAPKQEEMRWLEGCLKQFIERAATFPEDKKEGRD